MGLKLETLRDVYEALKRFGNGADNDFTKMAKIIEDEQHELVPPADPIHPPGMPDCQDLPLDKFSDRTKALAEDRGNSACGDPRMFKAGYVRVAMINAIHHEARSAYLAGYLQATKDLQE